MRVIQLLILGLLTSFFLLTYATDNNSVDYSNGYAAPSSYEPTYPWGIAFSRGYITTNNLEDVLAFQYQPNGTGLYALDLSYQPGPDHWYQYLSSGFGAQVEFTANFTDLMDPSGSDILQFNPYFAFRWKNFPWNSYLVTTVAAGEGVSFSSDVPTVEKVNTSTNFLNYLTFEITFSLPNTPQWQVIYKVYHRSGMWGLFYPWDGHAVGSNAFGFGIRYLFMVP